MDENQPKGGSGPALAAHSKDASAPATTSASSATGNDARGSGSARETVSNLSGQAREVAAQMARRFLMRQDGQAKPYLNREVEPLVKAPPSCANNRSWLWR